MEGHNRTNRENRELILTDTQTLATNNNLKVKESTKIHYQKQ